MSRLDFLVFCFGWCLVGAPCVEHSEGRGAMCRTQWGLAPFCMWQWRGRRPFEKSQNELRPLVNYDQESAAVLVMSESMDVIGKNHPWSYGCSSVRDTGASITTRLIITLRLTQNGCLFADNIFRFIFLFENCYDMIQISLKSVHMGPIINVLVSVAYEPFS